MMSPLLLLMIMVLVVVVVVVGMIHRFRFGDIHVDCWYLRDVVVVDDDVGPYLDLALELTMT